MSCFVTQGQKEGGLYLGPWNCNKWMSQQRTHKFEYVFRCWWINQELKQKQSKLNFWNQLQPKRAFLCRFWTKNSHLSTKPYNFDIKYPSNSESYDHHGFFGTMFRGGQSFLLKVEVFFNEREYSVAEWLVPLINRKYLT